MTVGRALLTESDREHLKSDEETQTTWNTRWRTKQRIDQLTDDLQIIHEHHPESDEIEQTLRDTLDELADSDGSKEK